MTDVAETTKTDDDEELQDAELKLRNLIDKMKVQKNADDIEYVKEICDVLEHLGIYSTTAQAWQEVNSKTELVFSLVIPMAGLEELRKIIVRAVMAS